MITKLGKSVLDDAEERRRMNRNFTISRIVAPVAGAGLGLLAGGLHSNTAAIVSAPVGAVLAAAANELQGKYMKRKLSGSNIHGFTDLMLTSPYWKE